MGDQQSAPVDESLRSLHLSNTISNDKLPDFGIDGHETDDESQEAITPHLSRDGLDEDLVEPDELSYVTTTNEKSMDEVSYSDHSGRGGNDSQENERVVSV